MRVETYKMFSQKKNFFIRNKIISLLLTIKCVQNILHMAVAINKS